MKVKKHNLLLIASIVWLIAGFNILKIGIETYVGYTKLLNFFLSIIVFIIFWFAIFYKLTKKHTHRIHSYEIEKQFFLNFFDLKSFIIMAFMIIFGITIRTFNLLPDRFIAIFYTGLGAALFLAGIIFGLNYYKSLNKTLDYSPKFLINIAIIYFILSMAGGVFYREFTKFYAYSMPTVLSVIHPHLLILGTLLFIILAVIAKVTNIQNNRLFKKFVIIYNFSLPFMILTMLIRGILQITNTAINSLIDKMLSGFAGLSHITMMIALLILLISLKKEFTD